MPSFELGPFHLVDHQVRVHPEQGLKSRAIKACASEIGPIFRTLENAVLLKEDSRKAVLVAYQEHNCKQLQNTFNRRKRCH